MSYVTVQKLSISYLGKPVFEDVGFQVGPGDRIGLIGPNGSGKTTLFRILAGEATPDGGDVQKSRNLTIGYLPQDVQDTVTGALLDTVVDAIEGRADLRDKIAKVESDLHDGQHQDEQLALSARLADLHEQQNEVDGRYPPHEAERILTGLGFRQEDFGAPAEQLSGGWKMRAALAVLLYRRPDLLLMDEPTNHLDIPSVHWLEGFLQTYPGAMFLVCHDRWFLNRQINRIISFEPEGVRSYSGDYDAYLLAREEERKVLEAAQRNQEIKVREAKRFIERFRFKASKARQAQSKIKLLRKMEIIETHKERKTIHFTFPDVERTGRDVITIDGISKAFGENRLYNGLSAHVFRGDRIALIGPNGVGKTTLLRLIAEELAPDEGAIRLGQKVTMSYYAQHHSEMLSLQSTVVEEVARAVPSATVGYVRNVCGAFLFSGDAVDKSIRVLSGGEKARVALARCLVSKANLMIMDEPTNHLDLESSEVLMEALVKFGGTLLFVSHNQSFVHRLATRIWDMREGELIEYPGSLSEYYDHLERHEALLPTERQGTAGAAAKRSAKADGASRKEERRARAELRQKASSRLKPIQNKLAPIERRIEKLEAREKELEALLASPEILEDKEKQIPLFAEYGQVRSKLEELLGRWEYLQTQLEEAKAEIGLV